MTLSKRKINSHELIKITSKIITLLLMKTARYELTTDNMCTTLLTFNSVPAAKTRETLKKKTNDTLTESQRGEYR